MSILHICITAIMASAPTLCRLIGNLWHKQLLSYSLNKYWCAATIWGGRRLVSSQDITPMAQRWLRFWKTYSKNVIPKEGSTPHKEDWGIRGAICFFYGSVYWIGEKPWELKTREISVCGFHETKQVYHIPPCGRSRVPHGVRKTSFDASFLTHLNWKSQFVFFLSYRWVTRGKKATALNIRTLNPSVSETR